MQEIPKKTQKIIADMSDKFSKRYIGRSLGLSAPTVKKYIDKKK